MTVKNFYQPTPPVDWTKKLEEIYARQTRQLEDHHANLRARDKQMVAKAEAEDITKVFSSLASLSKTVASAVEAGKKSADKKREKDFKEIYNVLAPEDIKNNVLNNEFIVEYQEKRKELINDEEGFKKFLDGKGLSADLQDYLLNANGAQQIRIREFVGFEFTKQSSINYDKYLESMSPAEKEEYLRTVGTSQDTRVKHFKKWATGELNKLNIGKRLVANNLSDELDRIANTEGVLKGLSIRGEHLTVKNQELQNRFNVAFQSKDVNAASEVLQTEIKDLVKSGLTYDEARERTADRFYLAGLSSEFTYPELKQLKEGLIKHPAGKDGSVLFDQKTWDFIESGITKGNKQRLAVRTAENKERILNSEASYLSGSMSKEQYDDEVGWGLRNGLKNDKDFQRFQTLDPSALSPKVYNSERKEFEPYISGELKGSLSVKELEDKIKEVRSPKLKRELEAILKETKLRQSPAIGYPEDDMKTSADKIRNIGLDKTLKEGAAMTGNTRLVQNEITRKRRWFAEQYPATLEGQANANEAWESWLRLEGFYTVNDGKNKDGVGRFSPDTEGKYTLFTNSKLDTASIVQASRIENRQKATKKNLDKWYNRLNKGWKEAAANPIAGRTTKESLLKTAGSVLDPEDIIGIFTGNTDGTPFYSSEILLKAQTIGVPPSVLVREQGLALLNIDNEAKSSKLFGLESKLKGLTKQTDVQIRDAIESRDLLYQWERGMINSPNKQHRLYMELTKRFGGSDEVDRAELDKEEEDLKRELEEKRKKKNPNSLEGKTLEEQLKIKLKEFETDEEVQ